MASTGELDRVVPFAGLLRFLSAPAVEALSADPVVSELFSDRALARLERDLLERLSLIGSRCLLELYGSLPPGVGYEEFVDAEWGRGLAGMSSRFPVAMELMEQACGAWREATTILARRLLADREVLAGSLGWGSGDHGSGDHLVAEVSRSLGDVHNGGHRVLALTDADGHRMVYKPRPMAQEAFYGGLLEWVGDHGWSGSFMIPAVVDRGDHGWMEYVETRPAAGEGERSEYWYRAGGHLSLLRLVGATDLHVENLIACGPHPVMVDLECILQPSLHRALIPHTGEEARVLTDSVMFSGLLPGALPGRAGLTVDLSGYGGAPSQVTGTMIPRWVDLGTDRIRMGRMMAETPPSRNQPDEGRGPDLEMLVAGYRDMDAVVAGMPEPSSGLPPWVGLGGLSGRVVFRATALYSQVIRKSLDPSCLTGRDRFEAEVGELEEWVERIVAHEGDGSHPTADREWASRVVAVEKRSVAGQEIPWFLADVSTGELRTPGENLGDGGFRSTGLEGLNRRWRDTGERSANLQTDLIRISLEGSRPSPSVRGGGARSGADVGVGSRGSLATLTGASGVPDVVERAVEIGRRLRDRAVEEEGGGLWWVDSRNQGRTAVRVPALGDRGLHTGSSGVALFLAALARVTGDTAWGDLARRAVRGALAADVVGPTGTVEESEGGGWPGGGPGPWELAGGVSGRAWAALVVGDLLGDGDLGREGTQIMSTMPTPGLGPLDPLDVFGGWAGPLLAVTAMAARTGSGALAEVAGNLGRRIVSSLAEREDPRWPAGHRRIGFAHGSTGISLAVARAGAISGDGSLTSAAESMVTAENERLTRCGSPGNSAGSTVPKVDKRGWCWGTAGIVAARSPSTGPPVSGADHHLDFARAHTGSAPETNHRLCCGVAGQVLALAGPAPGEVPESLVGALAMETDRLVLEPSLSLRGASLFRGLAGVGYALLSTVAPLPRLLAVE